ncbi:unnamed protein product [Paramecium sonneborni]|uniref:Uncharacterized protein n=1 Tax=Paramecium sonneborni TaxID=65129 RepID=A0A8S1QVM8_9CILI|nr:unnamed protein product [Paramecium sonneborni]
METNKKNSKYQIAWGIKTFKYFHLQLNFISEIMNSSYTYDPKYSYYKSEVYPQFDQSITSYGIANSQIQQGSSTRLATYSTHGRNLSQPQLTTSQSQRVPVQFVQQSIGQSIRQPIVRSSSPLNQQKVYYTQSIQPVYRLYNEPIQVVQQAPQVNVVREIEEVPIIHEVHHINRPINVIAMDEIEGPWKSKQILLEKQLIELQLMLKRGPQKKNEIKQVIVEDEGRIRYLEQQIEKLKGILNENEEEIQNLESQVDQAQYNLENAEEEANGQIEEQNRELAKWKKKFQDLNKQYHDIEEDITMTEAQIESIQKRKFLTQTSSSIKTSSKVNQIRDSGSRRSSVKKNY